MASLDPWNFALLINKWIAYSATAAAVGGAVGLLTLFSGRPLRKQVLLYILLAAGIGMAVSASAFFIQVGAFAESGPAGMFDGFYVDFLWETSLRTAVLLKLGGFGCLAFAAVAATRGRARQSHPLLVLAVGLILMGSALLAASYPLVGHSARAETTMLLKAALLLHVLAMALWIGNLLPLRFACRSVPLEELTVIMRRFSKMAMWIVAVLLLCGSFVLFNMLGDLTRLFTTAYGLGLLGKLLLISVLLGMATLNKFYWMPRLGSDDARHGLSRTIELELLVAMLVLGLTASITTLTGPELAS